WDTVTGKEGHTFEVEPHGNFNHVAGSQEVQTQDLIYYHSTRDREQHLAWELFSYREDNNEAAFAVAAVDKIYAHESLNFNNTVACEVISMWKAELKYDMDARSDVYLLSNGCRKCSDDNDDEIWVTKGLLVKAKGNVLSVEIIRDQSGNTLRVSYSRVYNGKLVQTLLEGHYILSLEGSLSRDCNVEKNDVGDGVSRHIGFKVAMPSAFEISSVRRVPEKSDIVIPVATRIYLSGILSLLSGTHARFLKKGGELFVMDLDSINGDTNTVIFRVLKVRNLQPIAKSSDSEPQVEVEIEGTTNVMESASQNT
ncbi:hypothetical protein Tco_0949118, partial [Tanacetum coccineum]